jgi:hypothetical protein
VSWWIFFAQISGFGLVRDYLGASAARFFYWDFELNPVPVTKFGSEQHIHLRILQGSL